MIQLYEFTVLLFYRLFFLALHYIDTLRLYGFTVNFAYGKFCKFTKFTVLRSESGMLRLQIYAFTVLRFYRFSARLGKRRALDPRLAHRHHHRLIPKFHSQNSTMNH